MMDEEEKGKVVDMNEIILNMTPCEDGRLLLKNYLQGFKQMNK